MGLVIIGIWTAVVAVIGIKADHKERVQQNEAKQEFVQKYKLGDLK